MKLGTNMADTISGEEQTPESTNISSQSVISFLIEDYKSVTFENRSI